MKTAPNVIPAKWAWHQRTLLRLRADLLAARQEHDHAVRVAHTQDGADAVDVADDEVELATLRAELSQEESELSEIEAALQRLENGKYGLCEVTGNPISAARLRALPWSRLSKAAAEQKELAAGRRRRS